MRMMLVYSVAGLLILPALALYLLLNTWELWHFGPSQWILNALRWLNYKAFKPVSEWAKNQRRVVAQQQKKEV